MDTFSFLAISYLALVRVSRTDSVLLTYLLTLSSPGFLDSSYEPRSDSARGSWVTISKGVALAKFRNASRVVNLWKAHLLWVVNYDSCVCGALISPSFHQGAYAKFCRPKPTPNLRKIKIFSFSKFRYFFFENFIFKWFVEKVIKDSNIGFEIILYRVLQEI